MSRPINSPPPVEFFLPIVTATEVTNATLTVNVDIAAPPKGRSSIIFPEMIVDPSRTSRTSTVGISGSASISKTTTLYINDGIVGAARETIESLLSKNEFLGYQLAHAQGGIDDDEFEKIVSEYLVAPDPQPDIKKLAEKSVLLAILVPNKFDATLVASAFSCEIDQAEEAIRYATINLNALLPHELGSKALLGKAR